MGGSPPCVLTVAHVNVVVSVRIGGKKVGTLGCQRQNPFHLDVKVGVGEASRATEVEGGGVLPVRVANPDVVNGQRARVVVENAVKLHDVAAQGDPPAEELERPALLEDVAVVSVEHSVLGDAAEPLGVATLDRYAAV